jgi:ketosteroid isomerase-like protein
MNATISKLRDIMNAHDAKGLAALFAPDYRSEQPAHPNRGFGGHDQVEANWTEMFRGVPDLTAEVFSEVTVGSTSWSEWIWRGHHTDGSDFEMRGVIVMGLTTDGRVAEARLYMEPVEHEGAAIEETVRQLSTPSST